jgi:hypothetical protein
MLKIKYAKMKSFQIAGPLALSLLFAVSQSFLLGCGDSVLPAASASESQSGSESDPLCE